MSESNHMQERCIGHNRIIRSCKCPGAAKNIVIVPCNDRCPDDGEKTE